MAIRISISGFRLRSFSQRYHSLGEDLNVGGRWAVAGWPWSSTRRMADVGRHVLLTYDPAPSLLHKADVRRVCFGGVERDDSERWGWSAPAERESAPRDEGSQGDDSIHAGQRIAPRGNERKARRR